MKKNSEEYLKLALYNKLQDAQSLFVYIICNIEPNNTSKDVKQISVKVNGSHQWEIM